MTIWAPRSIGHDRRSFRRTRVALTFMSGLRSSKRAAAQLGRRTEYVYNAVAGCLDAIHLPDHQGKVRELVDHATREIVEEIDFDAFGNIVAVNDTPGADPASHAHQTATFWTIHAYFDATSDSRFTA